MSAILKCETEPKHADMSETAALHPIHAKHGKINVRWFAALSAATLTLATSVATFALVRKLALSAPALPALVKIETPALAQIAAPTSLQSERRLGFLSVTGEVVNQTANPLTHVEAVLELMDADGRVVQTASSVVEFDPIPARGKSGFNIATPDSPNVAAYRVQFRELLGRNLN